MLKSKVVMLMKKKLIVLPFFMVFFTANSTLLPTWGSIGERFADSQRPEINIFHNQKEEHSWLAEQWELHGFGKVMEKDIHTAPIVDVIVDNIPLGFLHPAVDINGKVWVPAEEFFEAYGVTVLPQEREYYMYAQKGNTKIRFGLTGAVGSVLISDDGHSRMESSMDGLPFQANGVLYVSLQDMVNGFSLWTDYTYDQETGIATVVQYEDSDDYHNHHPLFGANKPPEGVKIEKLNLSADTVQSIITNAAVNAGTTSNSSGIIRYVPSGESKEAAAVKIAQSIAADLMTRYTTDLARVKAAAKIVSCYCGYSTYTMEGPDYATPYGVFIQGEYSCAGATRALGLILDYMNLPWTHINPNQYTHQWLELEMDGHKGFADGQGGFADYGEYNANTFWSSYFGFN